MKTSAIVCAVLAGSFGLSSVALAQDGRRFDRGDRGDRAERRHEQRADRREDRREERREAWRNQQRQDRAFRQGWQAGYQQPRYNPPQHVYQQPRYNQPHYVYQQPSYRAAHRFHRGSYLPYQYRQQPYYVNNWHAYPSLYAPPYGHQWINVDGEFLLVALATGLIANALLN
jgi:Ni/Co efflux regulator RcnB